jgi:putative membrane protein
VTVSQKPQKPQRRYAAYLQYARQQLVLRDELAIDRTLLANERTLLAYLRSGVALVIAGATIMHFAELGWFHAVGVACIPLGAVVAFVGAVRFRRMHMAIVRIGTQTSLAKRPREIDGEAPAA